MANKNLNQEELTAVAGASEQSDEQLLTVLLGEKNLKAARELMPNGRIADLEYTTVQELSKRGVRAFARAAAFMELSERLVKQRTLGLGINIKGAADIAKVTRHAANDVNESFYLLCMSSGGDLISCNRIVTGDQTKINFNPRIVIENALAHKAYRVAFVHNHPDGNAKPSGNDQQAMMALYGVCHSVSLHVLDSVIVARNGYYSFASRELKAWGPERDQAVANDPEKRIEMKSEQRTGEPEKQRER